MSEKDNQVYDIDDPDPLHRLIADLRGRIEDWNIDGGALDRWLKLALEVKAQRDKVAKGAEKVTREVGLFELVLELQARVLRLEKQLAESNAAVYSVEDFIQRFSISRTRLYEEVNAGRLKIRKNGHRTIILKEDADAWKFGLPSVQ